MTSPVSVLARLCREIKIDPPARHGSIYFLVDGDAIVYVGQTTNIDLRISAHVNIVPRDGAVKLFTRALAMDVAIEHLDAYEGALIRRLWPRYNLRAPAHSGGDNAILIALGLEPHDDEAIAARRWSEHVYRPRIAQRRRRAA